MGGIAERYTYRVRWSEEDSEFVATVAEFPSLSWLDESQTGALLGLVRMVGDVVREMGESGEEVPVPFGERSFSGNVRLRMPPEQHREMAMRAAEEGVSLNRLLCSLIGGSRRTSA